MATRRALKAVLVDLSGTLHIEDVAVPGAQEALKRLRSAPLTIRFVTNTTKECKQDLLQRLKKLEFDIQEDEIFTSLTAARNLLEQKQVGEDFMETSHGLLSTFHRDVLGLKQPLKDSARYYLGKHRIETNNPNAVVIGLAPDHFNYEMMNKAFR
ncbi:hypothetical protein JD844_008223 [Phrynosoma platyrhinos]|uniref:Haloacid dehalogenase-like hydrolase domain-containing protein 2 n=1 Tax=Phrynosoma platyrhinos TaxID=52577 RepID=A0ABQ7TDI4_PHRPL|nr:hypothetical protein JD844_008223 [Phrynosoma platyrhinos]